MWQVGVSLEIAYTEIGESEHTEQSGSSFEGPGPGAAPRHSHSAVRQSGYLAGYSAHSSQHSTGAWFSIHSIDSKYKKTVAVFSVLYYPLLSHYTGTHYSSPVTRARSTVHAVTHLVLGAVPRKITLPTVLCSPPPPPPNLSTDPHVHVGARSRRQILENHHVPDPPQASLLCRQVGGSVSRWAGCCC